MDKNLIADIRFSFNFEVISYHLQSEERVDFVREVAINKGEFLAHLMNIYFTTLAKESGMNVAAVPVFTKEQFNVSAKQADERRVFVIVELPEDDSDNMSCLRYIFVWDKEDDSVRYFTVEKNEGKCLLCEVDAEKHSLYGEIKLDEMEILYAVYDIVNQNI